MRKSLILRLSLALAVFAIAQAQVLSAGESAQDLYHRGYREFKSGQYKTSIQTFNQAIDIDKMYWDAYWGRGFASMKLGQFAMALNEFTRFLSYREGYGNYGDMKPWDLNFSEKYEEANQSFSELLKKHDNWYLHAGRSVALLKLKKLKEAKADLDLAIKNVPQQYSPMLATIYAMRGNCKLALGDAKAAVDDYSQGLSAREVIPIYRARAIAYKKLGKTELAAKDEASSKSADSERGMKMILFGSGSDEKK